MSGPGPIEEHRRTIGVLQDLIVDLIEVFRLSDANSGRIAALRRRVANALPPDKMPPWLEPFRDPSISGESES